MTNRPTWAIRKNRRWKVVTSNLQSQLLPSERSGIANSDCGTTIQYKIGKVKRSPNGVDVDKNVTCSRGIHAYTSLESAISNCQLGIYEKILVVYAPRWYGKKTNFSVRTRKERASQIYVSSLLKK